MVSNFWGGQVKSEKIDKGVGTFNFGRNRISRDSGIQDSFFCTNFSQVLITISTALLQTSFLTNMRQRVKIKHKIGA